MVILLDQKLAFVEIKVSRYNMINTQRLRNTYLDAKIQNVNTGIQLDLIPFILYFLK